MKAWTLTIDGRSTVHADGDALRDEVAALIKAASDAGKAVTLALGADVMLTLEAGPTLEERERIAAQRRAELLAKRGASKCVTCAEREATPAAAQCGRCRSLAVDSLAREQARRDEMGGA
jgi:hypothetical protein